MRVLLVEDDAPLRAKLAQALRGAGWVVDAIDDGDEALWLGREESYDAAVLDLGRRAATAFPCCRPGATPSGASRSWS